MKYFRYEIVIAMFQIGLMDWLLSTLLQHLVITSEM